MGYGQVHLPYDHEKCVEDAKRQPTCFRAAVKHYEKLVADGECGVETECMDSLIFQTCGEVELSKKCKEKYWNEKCAKTCGQSALACQKCLSGKMDGSCMKDGKPSC